MADQKIDACKKCGSDFDEQNTGYAKGHILKDGTQGYNRFCRACHRAKNTGGALICRLCGGERWISYGRGKAPRCADCNALRCRDKRRDAPRPRPVPKPEPKPVPIDHSLCEPWGLICCVECRALYIEPERGGATVDAVL